MNRLARRFVRDYDIRINAHYVGIGVSRCAVWYHYRSVDVIICDWNYDYLFDIKIDGRMRVFMLK